MASASDIMGNSKDENMKVSAFLLSPMIGFAIWLAFTCCLGMFLPYNRVFLLVLFSIAMFYCFVWLVIRYSSGVSVSSGVSFPDSEFSESFDFLWNLRIWTKL